MRPNDTCEGHNDRELCRCFRDGGVCAEKEYCGGDYIAVATPNDQAIELLRNLTEAASDAQKIFPGSNCYLLRAYRESVEFLKSVKQKEAVK